MTIMTDSAEARLNDYLAQVRLALDAHPDVSPDEVAADICEHIDNEFAGRSRPVTLEELGPVLARLGPPSQWAGSGVGAPSGSAFDWKETLRGIRRTALGILQTLWKGPEDWRLPYLVFGLTLLAPLTIGISLIAAYFLARATVELAAEKGQPLGARRWLVYPAILAVSLPLLLGLMFGPAIAAGNIAADEHLQAVRLERASWIDYQLKPIPAGDRVYNEKLLAVVRLFPVDGSYHQEILLVVFSVIGCLAAWWIVLGLALRAIPKWATTLFHPLLDGCGGQHGVRLATFASVAFLVWAGTAYRLWANVG